MNLISKVRATAKRLTVVNDHLRDLRCRLSEYGRFAERRKFARDMRSPSLHIDPQKGYVLSSADKVAGLPELVAQVREFADAKIAGLDRAKIEASARQGSVKPFYFNILDRDDVNRIDRLMPFAVSPPVLSVLAEYYGILPELSHVAVFYSGFAKPFEPDSKPLGTQCLHWDNHDRRHVKMFTYLSDVGPDDGPLTILPADKSWWLRRRTGRVFGTSPLRDDAELFRYFGKDDLVPLTGPAGTVAFVDTTKCLHFGSRCKSGGSRTTLVLHYARFATAYSVARTSQWQDLNVVSSPECRAGLNLGPAEDLVYRLNVSAA
jgi:hypothetical protein